MAARGPPTSLPAPHGGIPSKLYMLNCYNTHKTLDLEDFIQNHVCEDGRVGEDGIRMPRVRSITHFTMLLPVFVGQSYEKDKEMRQFLVDDFIQSQMESQKILNWCKETTPLYPIRTIGDGNCLLHSASIAMWAVHDRKLTLRHLLHIAMTTDRGELKTRWQKAQAHQHLELMLRSVELSDDWERMVALASTQRLPELNALPYHSLEDIHIFVLAQLLRRPVIVLSDAYMRNMRGSVVAPNHAPGIYLPLLWPPGSCVRAPIVLAYFMNHFSPLVAKKGDDVHVHAVPLVNKDSEALSVHYMNDAEESRVYEKLEMYLDLIEVPVYANPRLPPILAARLSRDSLPTNYNLMLDFESKFEEMWRHPRRVTQERPEQSPRGSPTPRAEAPKAKSCITPGCKFFGTPEKDDRCTSCHKAMQRLIESGKTLCCVKGCVNTMSEKPHYQPYCNYHHYLKGQENMNPSPQPQGPRSTHTDVIPQRRDDGFGGARPRPVTAHLPGPLPAGPTDIRATVSALCRIPGCRLKCKSEYDNLCTQHYAMEQARQLAEKIKVDETPKVAGPPTDTEPRMVAEAPRIADIPKVAEIPPKVAGYAQAVEKPKVAQSPNVAENPKVVAVAGNPQVAESPKVTQTPENPKARDDRNPVVLPMCVSCKVNEGLSHLKGRCGNCYTRESLETLKGGRPVVPQPPPGAMCMNAECQEQGMEEKDGYCYECYELRKAVRMEASANARSGTEREKEREREREDETAEKVPYENSVRDQSPVTAETETSRTPVERTAPALGRPRAQGPTTEHRVRSSSDGATATARDSNCTKPQGSSGSDDEISMASNADRARRRERRKKKIQHPSESEGSDEDATSQTDEQQVDVTSQTEGSDVDESYQQRKGERRSQSYESDSEQKCPVETSETEESKVEKARDTQSASVSDKSPKSAANDGDSFCGPLNLTVTDKSSEQKSQTAESNPVPAAGTDNPQNPPREANGHRNGNHLNPQAAGYSNGHRPTTNDHPIDLCLSEDEPQSNGQGNDRGEYFGGSQSLPSSSFPSSCSAMSSDVLVSQGHNPPRDSGITKTTSTSSISSSSVLAPGNGSEPGTVPKCAYDVCRNRVTTAGRKLCDDCYTVLTKNRQKRRTKRSQPQNASACASGCGKLATSQHQGYCTACYMRQRSDPASHVHRKTSEKNIHINMGESGTVQIGGSGCKPKTSRPKPIAVKK